MNENAKKWVEALRSGEFPQTKNNLHDEHGYCCLGVACEVYNAVRRKQRKRQLDKSWHRDSTLDAFPEVMEWLGLRDAEGGYRGGYLAEDNDAGCTFSEIADRIESEPEGLFVEVPR